MEYSVLVIFQLILLASTKQDYKHTSKRSLKADQIAYLENSQDKFAVDLFLKTSRSSSSVISPFSAAVALAMAYAGAGGKTERQINKVIAEEAKNVSIHSYFGDLLKNISNIGNEDQLCSANRIYVKKGYKILTKFIETLRSYYGGQFEEIKFLPSEQAAKIINKWVESVTNSKIKEIAKKDMFNKYTRLVLINAIYFKAKWRYEFVKNNTKNRAFYESKNKQRLVEMMEQRQIKLPYYEDQEVQIVGLSYENPDLKMFVFLPTNKFGLNDFEKSLNSKRILCYVDGVIEKNVIVKLPKFKISSEFSLKESLMKLGIKDAFNRAANFSGIVKKTDLYIDNVIQKTFIEVNEQGTETAAATLLEISEFKSSNPVTFFTADHPFIFAILYKRNILFIGRFL